MQHPWIPARGTCRRQVSVEFDMCHWSEEPRSSSQTSSKWSPCSKTCMQRLQLLQLDLSVLTAAESVLRTSVSAVTFVSTYDRTTDNHISATSSSKSTGYHKQASKQQCFKENMVGRSHGEFVVIEWRGRNKWVTETSSLSQRNSAAACTQASCSDSIIHPAALGKLL